MIATGCNDTVIDSLLNNNNDDDDNEDIPLNSNLEIVTQFICTTLAPQTPPPPSRLSPRHKADFNNENGSDASVILASKIIHHSYILMQSIKVL